ncbi:MAG TPA: methyltransferase domain-containing protein [Caulobacteraceae bacterium]|nr:methyltransferase domain-containing protein [Caulobacteraceae bacterium]
MGQQAFEALIADAERQTFEGWDFSHLAGRMVEAAPPFDYGVEVRRRLPDVARLLDLGTGGGEVLSQFAPFPAATIATEAYPPNARLAARRLAPFGASVVLVEGAPENWESIDTPLRRVPALPFRDGAFDLVIDRHESYLAAEVHRVLHPGGRFVTQQCGGTHHAELNDLLGLPRPRYAEWRLEAAATQLSAAGFVEVTGREAFTETLIHDVGAIVCYLRALPWQAPNFRARDHLEPLKALHDRIAATGPLTIRAHHFLVEAVRPA